MGSSQNRSVRASRWREYAKEGIGKASVLPEGPKRWSPSKPAETAIDRARALVSAIKSDELPLPMTSAGPDGVFCLEWREPDRKLVFYIFDNGLIEFYVNTPHVSQAEGEIGDRIEQANEVVQTYLRR